MDQYRPLNFHRGKHLQILERTATTMLLGLPLSTPVLSISTVCAGNSSREIKISTTHHQYLNLPYHACSLYEFENDHEC